MTFASLFTGGGGADIGAMQAGLVPAWGIEYDPDIADAARLNLGDHIKTMNVLDANPANFDRVDVLHASPPCPNFSSAKANAEETALDIALAAKVAEFISVLKPRFFTLENVRDYAHSKSLKIIVAALSGCGYAVNSWVLNAADYGVPQTRKRLIVVARRDGVKPSKPEPTHTETPTPLFDHRRQWVGWYEAIADLIPNLPESQLAPWQIARMPDIVKRSAIFAQGGYEMKAVLIGGANTSAAQAGEGVGCSFADEPTRCVNASNSGQWRAVLVAGAQNTSRDVTILDVEQPSSTVICGMGHRPSNMPFVLVESGNVSNAKTFRFRNEPAATVTATHAKHMNKVLNGIRTVTISPRCLARFQSFPDSYILPDSLSLAVRIVGNAVPPMLYLNILGGSRQ